MVRYEAVWDRMGRDSTGRDGTGRGNNQHDIWGKEVTGWDINSCLQI